MLTQATASVSFSSSATEGIVTDVLAAFHALPRRGAESGGVLFGRFGEERILIEGFEPVVCEHRWGPSYILSEGDYARLEETLTRCQASKGTPPLVGFYRSHTRGDMATLDDRDRALFDRYFPDPRAVFVLLQPDRSHKVTATYLLRSGGTLRAAAAPARFAGEDALEVSQPDVPPGSGVEPQPPAPPTDAATPLEAEVAAVPPRRTIPPPTRPRLTAPSLTNAEEAPAERDRRWLYGLVALCVGAGLLGYWSLGPSRRTAAPPAPAGVSQPASPAAAPVPAPSRAVEPPAKTTPAPAAQEPTRETPSVTPAVRETLDRWARALRSGNPKAIAAFYAPRVDSYFGEHNVSSAAVGRARARSAARYGKTEVARLSGIRITPLGNDRAIATFRKHWQTSGAHTYSGESEERLELAKRNDSWKITSERETRVLWTERAR